MTFKNLLKLIYSLLVWEGESAAETERGLCVGEGNLLGMGGDIM